MLLRAVLLTLRIVTSLPSAFLADAHGAHVNLGTQNMSFNKSIDADPQQQNAASPLMLVGRSFLRYPACGTAAFRYAANDQASF